MNHQCTFFFIINFPLKHLNILDLVVERDSVSNLVGIGQPIQRLKQVNINSKEKLVKTEEHPINAMVIVI